jgi:uncharacterized protein
MKARRQPVGVYDDAFVDTSAYYALTDRRESNHATARAIAAQLADERRILYTTNLILAETHALVLARLGSGVALRVLREIDRSEIRVIRPDDADEQNGRTILARYADKTFSLADAISFATMDRLRIVSAFTFDQHFVQYGKRVLDAPTD